MTIKRTVFSKLFTIVSLKTEDKTCSTNPQDFQKSLEMKCKSLGSVRDNGHWPEKCGSIM